MSMSERKRLEQIDRKVGRLHGQFQDITREMTRLYEAELNAEELVQKILTRVQKGLKQASELPETGAWDMMLDTLGDIELLCKEQLQKEGDNA